MSPNDSITLDPRTVKRLIIAQSVINGLLMLASAAAFADFIGPKQAAVAVAVVSAVNQVIGSILAKNTGDQAAQAAAVVETAGAQAASAANATRSAATEVAAIHRDLRAEGHGRAGQG